MLTYLIPFAHGCTRRPHPKMPPWSVCCSCKPCMNHQDHPHPFLYLPPVRPIGSASFRAAMRRPPGANHGQESCWYSEHMPNPLQHLYFLVKGFVVVIKRICRFEIVYWPWLVDSCGRACLIPCLLCRHRQGNGPTGEEFSAGTRH